jgi:hypothetical protein
LGLLRIAGRIGFCRVSVRRCLVRIVVRMHLPSHRVMLVTRRRLIGGIGGKVRRRSVTGRTTVTHGYVVRPMFVRRRTRARSVQRRVRTEFVRCSRSFRPVSLTSVPILMRSEPRIVGVWIVVGLHAFGTVVAMILVMHLVPMGGTHGPGTICRGSRYSGSDTRYRPRNRGFVSGASRGWETLLARRARHG